MTKSELIHLCIVGNKDAMSTLYSIYAMKMMNIIRKYVSDPKTSEDILHDGFIIIYTHIDKLRDESRLESWMAGIMRNISLKYLEKLDISTILDENTEIIDLPESNNILSLEELETIIDKLPNGYKTIFRLSVLENKSHKEIGELLGITPSTSSSQLFHAKVLLRKLIKEYQTELDIIILIIFVTLFSLRNNKPNTNDTIPSDIQISLNNHTSEEPNDSISSIFEIQKNSISDLKKRFTTIAQNNDSKIDSIINNNNSAIIFKELDNTKIETDEIADSSSIEHQPLLAVLYTQPNDNISKKSNKWNLSISYTTVKNNSNTSSILLGSNGIGSDIGSPSSPQNLECHYHYNMPISFGINLDKSINQKIRFNTGLSFTYLRSYANYDLEGISAQKTFNHYYISIPLGVNYTATIIKRCALYIPGKIGVDIPLKTQTKTINPFNITLPEINNPKPQLFISTGLGLEYKITTDINLYAEPSIKCYLNKTSEPSIWEGRRVEFNLPVGVRFSW